MPITLKREHGCLLCTSGRVTEKVDEHLLDPACVPDQGNCDFSEYKNYRVIGGKIIAHPFDALRSHTVGFKYPAVCDGCLRGKKVSALVDLMEEKFRCVL